MTAHGPHCEPQNLMESVLAAGVTGILAIVGILVEKGRRENKKDHNHVIHKLDSVSTEIRKDLRQVRYELNSHRDDLRTHIREDH